MLAITLQVVISLALAELTTVAVVELRPTTDGDLPALHATFVDAIATVFAPRGFDVPSPSLEVFSILQRHVLATGVGYVAEDDGEVVGFALRVDARRRLVPRLPVRPRPRAGPRRRAEAARRRVG